MHSHRATHLTIEFAILRRVLETRQVPVNYTEQPTPSMLIGTDGGGVINIGLTADRQHWWGTGVTGNDLTTPGHTLTQAVHAEQARRTRLGDLADLDDINKQTTWPSTDTRGHHQRTCSRGEGQQPWSA